LIKAVGIDFGTTNSAVAVADPDQRIILAHYGTSATFRSILYFAEEEETRQLRVYAGQEAIANYLNAKSPGRLIQSAKSYLASRLFSQTQILGQNYTLEELIGILLRHLRRAAEKQFGEIDMVLVAGRPVHFSGSGDAGDDEFAIRRLRAAYALAGFDEVRFLPEPVAAAYKYQQQLRHEELVLIADFGGGTSDFSLVHLLPKGSSRHDNVEHTIGQVVANDGIGVAGDSFDSKLVRHLVAPLLGLGSQYRSEFGKILPVPNWLYEHLERWHYLSLLKTRKNMDLLKDLRFQALEPAKIQALFDLVDHDLGYQLYRAIEAVKCALSEGPRADLKFIDAAMQIQLTVHREQFEAWIDREVKQIGECIDRMLAKCGVAPNRIDTIFMTGGSSFVPAIRRLFERKFPNVAIRAGQEFTSVAEGLALYASELFE
jgi:hypothetical chaperone protein